jgi:hypothetical protein
MKIAICSSLTFAKEMIEIKEKLVSLGHSAVISDFAEDFVGKTDGEKEKMNAENFATKDVIREFWKKIQTSDAILVLNFDKKGIKNYIGGNTLMEIGFAHVLNKKIFLMNDVPEIPFYKAEIIGVKPVILHEDLLLIK